MYFSVLDCQWHLSSAH